ncbi:MurR/RpiR family transcriptional regulator [Pseudonocardia acaciae]|uniref:MurR/RpiR family transcriptional regulator n=1 Tax=Pseudonocardia acaciae TaxID=551276 RepID=UPI000561BFDB|nr:MurR/RpiR family transcriptional regulator [Pseudonocardia acaciae]
MPDPTFVGRLRERLADLSPAEQVVASYLRDHAEEVLFASADQIGKATGTSNATVIRAAKSLGYAGLPELRHDLGMGMIGQTRPSIRLRNRIEHAGHDAEDLLDSVFAEAGERIGETRRLVGAEELTAATELISSAREVVAFGLGLSSLTARYLVMRLGRLGRRGRDASATGFALPDELLALAAEDVVVMYVPGRLLPDCEVVLDHAAEVGAPVILVSDSLTSRLRDRVRVCLPAVHTPSGLTGEFLTSLVLTDALLLAVAARGEERAAATSELLTKLRGRLYPGARPRRS